MFQRFPSLTRFSHDWTITEKIDGTNACIIVEPDDRPAWGDAEYDYALVAKLGSHAVYAQSRNNLIYPGKDNAGFASWVANNVEALVETLGEGRHFGEWCGAGIQRRYGLDKKKFALFNTKRWGALSGHPDGGLIGGQLTVVPVLAEGYIMDPEGVVMRHNPSGTVFKKTFDYDEQGKWAENQARRAEGA